MSLSNREIEEKTRLFSNFLLLIIVFLWICVPGIAGLEISPAYGRVDGKDDIHATLPCWPQDKSDLRPDPAMIFGKLANGLRYILMHNQNPKGRVSLHLDVQVGSLDESESERGVAHFLEHMQFNGSTHFEPGELVKYFQRIGMQFGPDANAHTGFNETVYDILLSQGDLKSIADGLLVMRDFADGALLLPSEIDKERKVILAEMRSRDSADYRTLEVSLAFEMPETLVPKRLPIGKESSLRNADETVLRRFYQTWYRPENMILVMVGDFDATGIPKIIKERFGDMQAKLPRKQESEFGKIEHQGIKPFYHFEKESGNTTVSIENVVKINAKPDSVILQRKLLIRHLADLILENRIEAMLKDPNTPFTSADNGTGEFLNKVRYTRISAETNPENWENTMVLLEKTLRTALIYGFQLQELERVKEDFQSRLNNAVKNAPTRNSKNIAALIIRNLNADRVLQSPQQEQEIFSPILKKIRIEDVNAAFRSAWSNNHRLLLVTGNARLGEGSQSPQEKILEVYKRSLASAVVRPKEVSKVEFPYLSSPKNKGKIVARNKIEDLEIEQVDFANGLRLNLKKTDFKRNEVTINVAFGHGRSSEPATVIGISELAQAVINESGLGRLTTDELQAALAGKESRVSFKIREQNFLISGFTVSDELSLLFQLIYAHLVDPGFRESAYRLSLERFRQRDLAMKKSVDGVMSMSGERFLAGGDSRFGSASFAEVRKISLAQIENWVRGAFKRSPLEVSIVGDFDTDKAVEAVARYLGSLPSAKSEKKDSERSNKILFPQSQSTRYTVETRIPKAMVVVAYPTEDFWDIHLTRRLSILADLLSERLRVYIREEMGAAYSPYAYNQAFRAYPGYGMLRAEITTDPKEAEDVEKAVKRIAMQISEQPITADELKRVLDPVLTSIKDLRRNNPYWLNTVLTLSSRYPQQIEWSRTIANDYGAITAEELLALAKKYVKMEKAATVLVVPDTSREK